MHKSIVEAIKDALSKQGKRGLSFTTIKPLKVNEHYPGGFWGLKITAKKGYVYTLPQVERVCFVIARFYGEELSVSRTMHTLIFT